MTLALRYAARSDVGLLRDGNEDAMYAGPQLLAVADGMGGHAAGEVASRVVIETIAELDTAAPAQDLESAVRDAVERANGYLRDMVAADSALEGMGTTLTALVWSGDALQLVHVGDSRGYLLRDGRLEQITHDHTLVQNLIDEGRITADEANTHPQRSWITRALDGRPHVELDLVRRDALPGDRYLLCSDGLSGYVSDAALTEALAGAGAPEEACDRLIDLALRAGAPDNVTCIVADVVAADGEESEPIVGGAAAQTPEDPAAHTSDTSAARAAVAVAAPPVGASGDGATAPDGVGARPRPGPATRDPDVDTRSEDRVAQRTRTGRSRPGRSRGGRLLAVVLVLVVALIAAGVVATWLYIRTQYYVGLSAGRVAVYRGVSGSVLGVDLSHVALASNLPATALPDYERVRVAAGIPAQDAADARRIVASLRTEACDRLRTAQRELPKAKRRPLPAYCGGVA